MESNKQSPSYYSVLGVSVDSSVDQIRQAYRNLAKQWHPDKWTKNPSVLGKAKRKFQQIQEAYSVLSDEKRRSMYDVGLYAPHDEEDEGFADFMQEISSLMKSVKKEEKSYTFGELQNMFWEMAESFNHPSSDDPRSSKRSRASTNPLSGIGMQETKCVWIA